MRFYRQRHNFWASHCREAPKATRLRPLGGSREVTNTIPDNRHPASTARARVQRATLGSAAVWSASPQQTMYDPYETKPMRRGQWARGYRKEQVSTQEKPRRKENVTAQRKHRAERSDRKRREPPVRKHKAVCDCTVHWSFTKSSLDSKVGSRSASVTSSEHTVDTVDRRRTAVDSGEMSAPRDRRIVAPPYDNIPLCFAFARLRRGAHNSHNNHSRDHPSHTHVERCLDLQVRKHCSSQYCGQETQNDINDSEHQDQKLKQASHSLSPS